MLQIVFTEKLKASHKRHASEWSEKRRQLEEQQGPKRVSYVPRFGSAFEERRLFGCTERELLEVSKHGKGVKASEAGEDEPFTNTSKDGDASTNAREAARDHRPRPWRSSLHQKAGPGDKKPERKVSAIDGKAEATVSSRPKKTLLDDIAEILAPANISQPEFRSRSKIRPSSAPPRHNNISNSTDSKSKSIEDEDKDKPWRKGMKKVTRSSNDDSTTPEPHQRKTAVSEERLMEVRKWYLQKRNQRIQEEKQRKEKKRQDDLRRKTYHEQSILEERERAKEYAKKVKLRSMRKASEEQEDERSRPDRQGPLTKKTASYGYLEKQPDTSVEVPPDCLSPDSIRHRVMERPRSAPHINRKLASKVENAPRVAWGDLDDGTRAVTPDTHIHPRLLQEKRDEYRDLREKMKAFDKRTREQRALMWKRMVRQRKQEEELQQKQHEMMMQAFKAKGLDKSKRSKGTGMRMIAPVTSVSIKRKDRKQSKAHKKKADSDEVRALDQDLAFTLLPKLAEERRQSSAPSVLNSTESIPLTDESGTSSRKDLLPEQEKNDLRKEMEKCNMQINSLREIAQGLSSRLAALEPKLKAQRSSSVIEHNEPSIRGSPSKGSAYLGIKIHGSSPREEVAKDVPGSMEEEAEDETDGLDYTEADPEKVAQENARASMKKLLQLPEEIQEDDSEGYVPEVDSFLEDVTPDLKTLEQTENMTGINSNTRASLDFSRDNNESVIKIVRHQEPHISFQRCKY